jgi:predicted RNA binding protein YcfA (HicA-like mRNA interferase family)
MAKLSPISFKELVKKLKKYGYQGPYSGGKHLYMIKENIRLTMPNPHKKDISVDLILKILKHVKISKKEWLGK